MTGNVYKDGRILPGDEIIEVKLAIIFLFASFLPLLQIDDTLFRHKDLDQVRIALSSTKPLIKFTILRVHDEEYGNE